MVLFVLDDKNGFRVYTETWQDAGIFTVGWRLWRFVSKATWFINI